MAKETATQKQWNIVIIEPRCKGCGNCIEFCPRDVLEFADHFNKLGYHPPRVKSPDNCIGCHLCEYLCPEFAIFVKPKST